MAKVPLPLGAVAFTALLVVLTGTVGAQTSSPGEGPTTGRLPPASTSQSPVIGTIRNVDALCETVEEKSSMIGNAAALTVAFGEAQARSMVGKWTGVPLSEGDERAALRRVSREAIWIPAMAEELFGNQQHKARIEAGFVVDRNGGRAARQMYERADKLFASLTALVGEEVRSKLKLHILTDNDVQAEAIPGGHVYVSRGALSVKDGDGVVLLLLGHEIAHITKRHQTKALQSRLVDTGMTIQGAQRLMATPAALPEFILGAVQTMRGRFAEYDQGQELESDACAMRLMAQVANVKPLQAVQQYLALQKDSGKAEQTREEIVYATHPQYPDRERRYNEAYAHHMQNAAVGTSAPSVVTRSGPSGASALNQQGTSGEPESLSGKARVLAEDAGRKVGDAASNVGNTLSGAASNVGSTLRGWWAGKSSPGGRGGGSADGGGGSGADAGSRADGGGADGGGSNESSAPAE